jgi:DNA (cytosine-5)-methyltransferase 1
MRRDDFTQELDLEHTLQTKPGNGFMRRLWKGAAPSAQASRFALNLAAKLVIVFFAGAGGSCTGIEKAIGRPVDYAINHNENALSCHRANHPHTEHLVEDVWEVDPYKLTAGRSVGYMHFSPDCTHFSQAKGGQPRSAAIRSLPWVTVKWCGTVRPEVFTIENVAQIQSWSRLIAKRDKATGRVVKLDGTVAAKGEHVPRHDQFLVPDPARKGQTWRKFLRILEDMGYEVDYRVLCAADYDVPQQRNRLFVIGRCDGRPIVWPQPVRAKEGLAADRVTADTVASAQQLPRWRAAYECVDWTLSGTSIFHRKKPLADATLRRIARGIDKFILNCDDPFIVPGLEDSLGDMPLTAPLNTRYHGDNAGSSARSPFPTITANSFHKRPGGNPPLGLVTAYLAQMNGGFNDLRGTPGHDLRRPTSTLAAKGSNQMLVAATLAHLRNNCDARDLRNPLQVISAGGEHHALLTATLEHGLSPENEAGALRCAAFVMEYYSQGGQWSDLRQPFNTVTTRDRLALVTVWIKGDPFVIVDICIRMLTPRELANASSLPPQYIISHGHDGRVFTKSQQVFFIGNCVPPELQYHVTAANCQHFIEPQALRRAA